MLRELKQPLPIQAMSESLLDSRGKLPPRILAAARQNQIEFRCENTFVRGV
jgi:hypothetical protein